MNVQGDICVTHLVHAANDLDAFTRFLDSYRRHPAGAAHAVAILLKGFRDQSAVEPYRRAASDICDHWLDVPDEGFDIGAYRYAALTLPYRKLVFVNSFSVIRADRWLELMASIGIAPDVGAVGASGSWASQFSHVRLDLGLGGPYRRVFQDRATAARVFAGLAPSEPPGPPPRPSLLRKVDTTNVLIKYARAFPGFPAPHLRTNCFLIDRGVWLSVCLAAPSDKLAAYRFESGRRSMTARLGAMGLRVVVAGCDGRAYETSEWPLSRAFWQGDQENLLVEDNQTRHYQHGDADVRRVLSAYAWGQHADPAEPTPPEAA